jgi:hypothetical protein
VDYIQTVFQYTVTFAHRTLFSVGSVDPPENVRRREICIDQLSDKEPEIEYIRNVRTSVGLIVTLP